MANLPANPGEALWIGSAAGKNHANIGIGQGTSNTANDHEDYPQSSIEDGSSPPVDASIKFYLNSDGNTVFRINASAGTTSSGTKHPRTECRETTPSGSNAAWDGRSGDHYLRARVRIITVTSNRPWICFGQIHGSSTSPNTSDVIRLQTEGTNGTSTNLSLIARRTPPSGGSEIRTVLKTGYNVGTWFDYELRQTNGTITVKIDGVTVLTAPNMGEIDQYFKYGCYLQDSLGEGASSGDWGAVEFERGSVQVWHTGYPTPTPAVFTGSSDPSGGPGGGSGNDTQAPTVPANLVAVRGDTQAALSWDASTDNVGVHHYNVYRFSTSGTAGGAGTSSTVGSTDNGDGATLSSADKMIASRATTTAAGTLAEGHARLWLDSSGSTTSRMLVYADSDGSPGAKLATSDQITITSTTADTVRDYVFSGAAQISLTADTDYWIVVAWDDPGTPSVTYSRGSVSSGRVEQATFTYGTFPDPFGTPSGTFSGPIDAWVTAVSGGSPGSGGGSLTSLGKTSNGASSSASTADKTAVSSATASASGTLTAGHARAWLSATGSAVTKCVVYADSSGAPGARLASSDPVTITQTAEAAVDYVFSGANAITITSGTTYWVGLAWQDPGTPSLNISRDATASGRQEASAYAPTPFGTPTALTGPIDVYVETTSSGGAVGGSFQLLTTRTTTNYTNTGLTNGIPYTYAVSAVDAAGNESAMSAPATVIPGPPDTTPPTVPTGLAVTAADERLTITWTASTDADSGMLRYSVYANGAVVALVTANATTATSVVLAGLTNGTPYSIRVSATDRSLNESALSSAVTGTPTAPAIGGAAFLPGRLTGGKVEVAIAWNADLTANESTWTWTDITADVRNDPGISTSLGRSDESSTSNPADLTLVLDNTAGDYSSVRRNTPVRVRVDPGSGGGRVVLQAFSNGFTPRWDAPGIPVVTLSASGTLRRLAQGSAPLQSVYRRAATALSSVKAYWPMEEGRASTFAYPVRGGTPFTYTGGSPSWAADDSFDCSAPLPTLSDAYGQAGVTAYTNTGTSQLRLLLSVPKEGLTDGTVLMHVSMTGTIHRWDITYGLVNGVESLGLYRYNASDGSLHSSDGIAFKVNGIPGRLSLDWTQSGSNIIWTMSFTPATPTGAATATFIRRTLTGRTAGIVSHFELNPHNANISATIGHLTVENAITSFFADDEALIAYSGEVATSSTGRLARLCTENGIPLQRYSGPVADVLPIDRMGPQLVAPLLDLLRECELAGQGQLWDGRSAGLSYTTRRRRELGTVKLTVNAAAGQLAGDFQAIDDDQRNRNKVTVTRLGGVAYTWEDTAGALGTAAVGVYDDAVTVNVGDDDSVVDFAKWFVKLGTVEGYRYPTVTVDLAASPTLAAAVLDIVPGERINVTNLDTTLAQFPDATVSLIVEGIAHEITSHAWQVTFRCSPYAPWAVGLTGATNCFGDVAASAPRPTGALAGTVAGTSALAGTTVPAVGALVAATSSGASNLASVAPKPTGALAGTVAETGALAGTTVPARGALTGTATTGTLSDLTSQSFTDSGGLTGTYHFYGATLPASGAGLVVHLHGDGAFEVDNPTSSYCLAGNRGMIAVAKAKGYALLVPRAPDTTGTVTWWEAGARNAQWLSELLVSIYASKGIDNTKVWLSGYSGGAEFISYYFTPGYGKARIAGGGALIMGGGGGPAAVTPVGWDSTFKAAFPMNWVTGGQDNGTYADDSFDALSAAAAGRSYYAGQGFTTTLNNPAGIGHEIDGAFGPILDDLLPAMSGYTPPSRTPGSTRPTLVTSYLVVANADNTSTTTTSSFTPSTGEVIVVKAFDADYGSPNIDAVTGGGLTYATKIHYQATSKSEAWIFVAEVGATSPGPMTVSVSWFGTTGRHGIIVERWTSGLVKGVPKQGGTVTGSGAPSSSITPDSANSVLTSLNVDWNVAAGTATYRTSATQTQQSSMSTVRAYGFYQNSSGTGAQTVGLSAPSGQEWSMGCIEILPAP